MSSPIHWYDAVFPFLRLPRCAGIQQFFGNRQCLPILRLRAWQESLNRQSRSSRRSSDIDSPL
jgi:hypothetical protein